MGAVRALQRRVIRLERAAKARPSPITVWFVTFDRFGEEVLQQIASGDLSDEFLEIVVALQIWESDGTWDRAYAS
jgi:hypothetical protein